MRHVTCMAQSGGGLNGMMTMTGEAPDFDISAPLRTDADVLKRAGFLIDEPDRLHRSLYLMFIDAGGVQLPLLVPVDGIPAEPDPAVTGQSVMSRLRRLR